jgi:hypothetical protein
MIRCIKEHPVRSIVIIDVVFEGFEYGIFSDVRYKWLDASKLPYWVIH